jgi:hypothetical protein
LVETAQRLGVQQISFLAVDVANPNAFGRSGHPGGSPSLAEADLPLFERELDALERRYAAQFHSGFIAESPSKLRRMLQYFAALCGQQTFPEPRCNAPEFSAVITAGGSVQPCYFISAPANALLGEVAPGARRGDLAELLGGPAMQTLRESIRAGARAECRTCVCQKYRSPDTLPASLHMHA